MRTAVKTQFISSKRRWVLVADRSKALFYSVDSNGQGLRSVAEFDNPDGRLKDGEINSDRQGRVKDRFGGARHSMSKSMTPSKQKATEFAQVIAEFFNRGRIDDRYDELVLIAPPTLIGLIRDAMKPATSKLICASIKKDLIGQTPAVQKKSILKAIEDL